jgi:Mn-dependent DtxR family transcriptional regulator
MLRLRQELTSHLDSPATEDYLEQIHNLILQKGYARVVDIAANLRISQASVSSMIKKMHQDGLVCYEKYRGVILTDKGQEIGREIAQRHALLTELFTMLGLDEKTIKQDVEGMEHHISEHTFHIFRRLLKAIHEQPSLLALLKHTH